MDSRGAHLAAAILIPVAGFGLVAYRAGKRSGRVVAGAIAGGVAGAISGGIAGVAYVMFGKSVLNVAVDLLAGAIGGALVGAAAARWGLRRAATNADTARYAGHRETDIDG